MKPRILLFTGKGGVGKTSMAAAHALASAGQGHRTVLISLDQAHNLGDLFEVGACPVPTRVSPQLDLLEIEPGRVREEEYPHLVSSLIGMLNQDSRFWRNAANDRLRQAFNGVAASGGQVMGFSAAGVTNAPADSHGLALWTRGFGSWARTDSDGNAAEFTRNTGGIAPYTNFRSCIFGL